VALSNLLAAVSFAAEERVGRTLCDAHRINYSQGAVMASEPSKAADPRSAASERPDGGASSHVTRAVDAANRASAPPIGSSDAPPPVDGEEPEDESRAVLKQLTVGTVVDGKYRVDSVLGRGAMGVVVAATHVHLGERAALKFLRVKAAMGGGGEDFQSRFRREAKVSARLKNEHVTRVIDVGVWRDRAPFMVMEYLVGSDVRQLVKANGPLPVPVVLDYATQVCTGIAEAHAQGIVHRDLKTSNLFVTKRADGTDLIKILDFGISKWAADASEIDELTKTGVVLGSPKYMAPEQLFGANEVDARADVWSIGAIVYELLTGRPPYDFPTIMRLCAELSTTNPPPPISDVRGDVPKELEAALLKCFARDPAERVPNVAELASSLLEAMKQPLAGAVRQRILAMLDPKSNRDPLGTSGASLAIQSGAFASISAISTGPGRDPSPLSASGAAALPVSADATRAAEPEAAPRKKSAAWVLAALLLIGIAAVTLWMKSSRDEPAKATGATTTPTATATTTPATATATATTPPADTASVAPTSTASAPSASSTADSSASAAPVPTARVRGRPIPIQPPPPVPTPKADPPPPPATATAVAPPPPPQPTATATTPPKKTNPLEDRQ
jgi:serine/threonine-protein kinase